jgi:hypothetical protein
MNINMHIERLIIDGVDIRPNQKKELLLVLEATLKQQLLYQGVNSEMISNHNRNSVTGGAITFGASPDTVNFGQLIGKAVYRGIGK